MAGLRVTLVDVRTELPDVRRAQLRRRGIELLAGHAIIDVRGTRAVTGVSVAALNAAATACTGRDRRIRCDLVCMSGGWNPAVHLFSQSGGQLAFDETKGAFVPGEARQAQFSAGGCNGTEVLAFALSEGREAGKAAAAACGFRKRGGTPLPKVDEVAGKAPIRPLWTVPSRHSGRRFGKHFVDFQNDVTVADVALAAREGYRSVEHLKRYTTVGMGTDQGKTSNVNALAILSETIGGDLSATGATTFRPPYAPVTFGALAGRDVGALSDRCAPLPCTNGTWSRARSSRTSGSGSGRGTTPAAGSRCARPWIGSAWPRATRSASWMRRRWGRSTSRGRTRRNFWNESTRTRGSSSRSGDAGTA